MEKNTFPEWGLPTARPKEEDVEEWPSAAAAQYHPAAVGSTTGSPSGASRPPVRRADYEQDEDGEECFQAWTSPQRPRQCPPQRPPPDDRRESGADRRCFRCGEPGHLARDCPAPASRARPSRPAGNYGGTAQ
ncbi:unnamed protein product [Arctogadus glacialis]